MEAMRMYYVLESHRDVHYASQLLLKHEQER